MAARRCLCMVPWLLMATILLASRALAKYEDLDFPGIYTAEYLQLDANKRKEWFQHADIVRIECDGNDPKQLRLCEAHILIKSHLEYQFIVSKVRDGSLECNSNLTHEWVHPRRKVADDHASKQHRATEELGQELREELREELGEELGEELRDRNDFLTSNRNQYSTIRWYNCYFDYEGTMRWIQDFYRRHASPFSPLEVTLTDIGDSWKKTKLQGGYDIFALTVTTKSKSLSAADPTTMLNFTTPSHRSSDTASEKAPFLIVSSTHAREYTPPILVRKWLEYIEEKVNAGDATYLSMLEQTKIHWIPYLNPDGRVLAETTQPMRRKNLDDAWTGNVRDSGICAEDSVGVDLNRNFPFEWGKSDGSSGHACSNYGRGSSPNSEPEVQALVNYALQVFPETQRMSNALVAGGGDYQVQHQPWQSVYNSSSKWPGYDPETTKGVFIDVHSYGKVYIYPWGNMDAQSPNDVSFRSALGHVESLTQLDALGPGNDHYGVASGASDDWAYGVLGAFSMTWELGSKFHEPCDDFEDRYERHLDAFEYLAQIAPFPYALGRGPVISSVQVDQTTLRLHYLQFEGEPDELGRNTTQTEFVRMETSANELVENITFLVNLKLPEILSSSRSPIDFDATLESHYEDDHHNLQPSSVTRLRMFFGDSHPLATAQTATSSFADTMEDYLEVDLSSTSVLNTNDRSSLYRISIDKEQLWQFFAERASKVSMDQMVYFQAMDNLGNPGTVNAVPLSIDFEMEEQDDDDWFASSSSTPTLPPKLSLTPQSRWEINREPLAAALAESSLPLASAWILPSVGVSTILISALALFALWESV